MKIKKSGIFLLILISISVFLLVYTPHYRYPFPSHIDEWHHITEAIKLERGEYSAGTFRFRFGFHLFLMLLYKIADLVLIYHFLPAIWAVLSSLVLFYVVYKKTRGQFYTALFAMIFFASIKSNVNITGLWFFTPLTFSIPFIYLYIYFFTEGVEKQDKRFIVFSLAIIVMLLFVHAISVLFAIPFLLVYSLFNLKYIKREWKLFSSFSIILLFGALFYKTILKVPWKSLGKELFNALQFKRGWGILELDNSFFELYSFMGYIMAIVGLIVVFKNKEHLKKYLAYILWPIMLLISITIYRKTGISYLSPYQRNLYYFAIGLPILSALGLGYLFRNIREFGWKIFAAVVLSIIIFFSFSAYFYIPKQIALYKIIGNDEYQGLLFLKKIPEKSVVMASPRVSTAIYGASGHTPVGTYYFYGNRKACKDFFNPKIGLKERMKILKKFKVKYVLSKFPIDCGWKLIYNDGASYIYETEQPQDE